MAVTVVSRTTNQLNAFATVGGFGMAMLRGAFVPVSAMPGWAQAIAAALPNYLAMKGFRSLVLEGRGIGDRWCC
jgi:ABC-2 type transport system permease protein